MFSLYVLIQWNHVCDQQTMMFHVSFTSLYNSSFLQSLINNAKVMRNFYLLLAGSIFHNCYYLEPLTGIAAAFGEKLLYSKKCADLLGVSSPDDPNPLAKMAMVCSV